VRGTFWQWNAEAQFLASRGYVVVEPEFRGSTGYGEKHFRAGWKQWGQAMQDDVTDALRFAVGKGWVDPARVCIMGASYGGYAALMGLAKDPEQYRCGVALAAVSDPRFKYEFHWSDASQAARDIYMPAMVGDPKKDAALLAAASPLAHVQRIKAPVFLAHGDDDVRVPLEHAERMLAALRKQGKDVEWQLYVDEGHGFSKETNAVDYYRRVESFMAKHLKAP
jgi:dipeptidyl aminopeptidase/acylaminoacyl peptidase